MPIYDHAYDFDTAPYAVSLIELEPLENAPLLLESHDLFKRLSLLSLSDTESLYRGLSTVGDIKTPLATLYAGHQFGFFNPQLGDGRAAIVGAFTDSVDASTFYPTRYQTLVRDFLERKQEVGNALPCYEHFSLFNRPLPVELQLKGAGRTPYSRMGDGKAVLRSSLREYVASEAMWALGIPTTRAMSLVHDPNTPVYREHKESAAIVLRVAPNFLRLGHIEYWGRHGYADRIWPYIHDAHTLFFGEKEASNNDQLHNVMLMCAILTGVMIAQWQAVGFCHGVMNSDNMSLIGLTIDYGPYGFLDGFDMGHVCNHSDDTARYSYKNQPAIALWNLQRCLEACEKSIDNAETYASIKTAVDQHYQDAFNTTFLTLYREKIGLIDRKTTPDIEFGEIMKSMLGWLHQQTIDYTRFFATLPQWVNASEEGREHIEKTIWSLRDQHGSGWLRSIYTPLVSEGRVSFGEGASPMIVPRNYLLQEMIDTAEKGDVTSLATTMKLFMTPYNASHQGSDLFNAPPDWASQICVSCSS